MRLYLSGRAPNPRRVRIFLAEKSFSIADTIDIDIMKKTHLDSAFAALNPFRRVPLLVLDDGTALSESVAICRYVEEALQPEPNLFGRDPKERALFEMWNRRAELNLLGQTAAVFRHLHPAMAELEVPQIAVWGDANKAKVLDTCALFDTQLQHQPFIAGERFSIADITAFVAVDFFRPAKIAIPDHLSALRRWHGDMSARPSMTGVN